MSIPHPHPPTSPFTIFNFQGNICTDNSQVFMLLSACMLNIMELNNHYS